jgi:acetylornithine deacetylase/succinyl-diaminopimelate desuccinylase-like protein
MDPIPDLLAQVQPERLKRDLYHLAKDPLPFRKLNYTRPGQSKSTLEEADDYIISELEAAGYTVDREGVPVQALRFAPEKPLPHKFAWPEPDDPWYTAYNLYAELWGEELPDEIVLVLAHKDSQSWVDSPGANDNAVGTVSVLELARILSGYRPRCTIRFLFCNEEHTPWTSVTAAKNARERGDNLIAIFNQDSMAGKPQADKDTGRATHVSVWTMPEGERLAQLMAQVNEQYGIGLIQSDAKRDRPGDDDGSFVQAGYPAAIINLGSWPYADPNYHTPQDTVETVDLNHVALATKATLAAIIKTDLNA